jgi:hypothetical protein
MQSINKPFHRDVYDQTGMADLSLMMGEKCFKWNKITTVATWKVMRLVERRVKGQGPQLMSAETRIQGLLLNLCILLTMDLRNNDRTDLRKPVSARRE